MSSETKNTVEEVLEIFNNGWNKQVILYGPPGTSKTYSATEIAAKFLAKYDTAEKPNLESHVGCEEYLNKKSDQYKVIQFHPSYSYEDFVRGIVVKTEDKNKQPLSIPTYEVERKIIETFGEEATKENPRVLVIDEINRAPLGSVLGELIYGLEYRGKAVSTPYIYYEKQNQTTNSEENQNGTTGNDNAKDESKEIPLTISEHLYIIGTMNTADRSIGTMDYAVRRRFAFLPVFPNPEVIEDTWNNPEVGQKAKNLFEKLMDEKDGIFKKDLLEDTELDVNDIKIGHTYFLGRKEENKEKKYELAYLQYRIDYQIRPVYQEYIKDGLIKKTGLEKFDTIVSDVMEANSK